MLIVSCRMLVLFGSSSISVQKRDILLRAIQAIVPTIVSVDAVWLHIVKCRSKSAESELSDLQSPSRKNLDHLLTYGDNIQLAGTDFTSHNVVYVLPRMGSISPWSSKATDISVICDLGDSVERLERGVAYAFGTVGGKAISEDEVEAIAHLLHDRMTQAVYQHLPSEDAIFSHNEPKLLRTVDLSGPSPKDIFIQANKDLGLALSPDEIDYLLDAYTSINRSPTDAELFMFAQVNSEHCRHKIFNASWTIDGVPQPYSLFQMIRNTEKLSNKGTLSAYSDNAAVLEGHLAPRFSPHKGLYTSQQEDMHILVKVETHNHPTAVSPYPGAATGSGGEIRDEGAVGRGSKPKAGMAGFTVSNLLIPGFEQPWETDVGRPGHISSALDIMIDAPLGASAFNNEFGRPALAGYFRTFCERVGGEVRGYHKPIMIAGGYGNVRPQNVYKGKISEGAKIVVLGGPGLLIGLGGGAASSQISGASSAELDFASVQRDNAEMQRRCQQVIDACAGAAGGLSNALPELVHDSGLGAVFEIRDVPVADASMSPMEIWCNESQERYVLAVSADKINDFEDIVKRERCPFGVVGVATKEDELVVTDRLFGNDVIRLKMSTLFGKPPKMSRTDTSRRSDLHAFDTTLSKYVTPQVDILSEAVDRVLHLPSVASKSFLITIGDRSITGLVTRDQMVGPYQVPVADVAVTRTSFGFDVLSGEAMAIGERTPLAILRPAASARIAIAEALTNLSAAYVGDIGRVKLSANWMCAAGKDGEGAGLYEAVKAVGLELCPQLGVGVPVGKDSMSMGMRWKQEGEEREVTAPLSLIVTAFAPVVNVELTWTPQLQAVEDTVLVLFDLAKGERRMGGSALAQVFKEVGDDAPDVNDAALFKAFLLGRQAIKVDGPRHCIGLSLTVQTGGLFTTIVEMAFAGHVGVDITLTDEDAADALSALFNEELGAVVQVRRCDVEKLHKAFSDTGFPQQYIHTVGVLNADQTVRVKRGPETLFASPRSVLQKKWSETSFKMQELRDNPFAAKEEFDLIDDNSYNGITYDLTFSYTPTPTYNSRPKVAILREQGVNGQIELAWAFTAAGFDAVDVHMSDILSGAVSLDSFRGVAAAGGFSYGDVLGAGKGWAHSVLLHSTARRQFSSFFSRSDTFTLAICNGCQFLSHLRSIIPGAQDWPDFKPNRSERFEGRTVTVEIVSNECTASSVFLREMQGSKLSVAVAHGEGRAAFSSDEQRKAVEEEGLVAVRYVDSQGVPTEKYPLNPNGSPGGITGVQTPDGRVLALMPHPERVVALESNSWYPASFRKEWRGSGPWFRLFQSARKWCEEV
ncbi:CobB/CobQ-like glutamine amidotransferase domain-containing protein [Desarmillaria tabescens]|uniref:Phosphoribosylformylglycinamidine synthase n=1 Tax=Armillaria tabescens TaxID=1929756 RepID=A0AA39TRH2_ARMTA|nr:CobB/CobQ-like glutamine amidotransferase domain-containing protein [Desarmillaria tabescens]KAK0461429.1 CobB/CobQ-like glutamine amidotransferase domain-containing protein [Desarmillaria tabescens]